eukprot:6172283-Pleurochrysis_carterae.AAC.2
MAAEYGAGPGASIAIAAEKPERHEGPGCRRSQHWSRPSMRRSAGPAATHAAPHRPCAAAKKAAELATSSLKTAFNSSSSASACLFASLRSVHARSCRPCARALDTTCLPASSCDSNTSSGSATPCAYEAIAENEAGDRSSPASSAEGLRKICWAKMAVLCSGNLASLEQMQLP